MLLCGENSIRDVIAFPKTQKATCQLTGAPSEAAKAQLDELNLRIKATAHLDGALIRIRNPPKPLQEGEEHTSIFLDI